MIELGKQKKAVEVKENNGDVELKTPTINISSSGGGTSDYRRLHNKPQINGIELNGNQTLEQLGIQKKGNYATKEQLDTKQPKGNYATEEALAAKQDKGNYALASDLDSKQDKGDYALRSEIPVVPEIPSKLPNPFKLQFTGASVASYDGSSAVTVYIPAPGSGGTGEDGGYYIPAVAEGVLSWTSSKPDMPQIESAIIKGEKGDRGEKGERGLQGLAGKDGRDGIDGKPGRDGINGAPGKDGADGYTPRKGIDYFDGKDGAPGKDGADGKQGEQGLPGKDGLNGADGKDGYTPIKGIDYFDGKDGAPGADGKAGPQGPQGLQGLQGLQGEKGEKGERGLQGEKGADGAKGEDGLSAYQIALQNGFSGSQAEWLLSLKGADGKDGADGKPGERGLQGLRGPQGKTGAAGKDGTNGKDGYTPIKGVDYFDGKDGKDGAPGAAGKDGINGKDGLPGAVGPKGDKGEPGKDGYTPQKGIDYFDGAPGKDGLPGPKGDKGDSFQLNIKGTKVNDLLKVKAVDTQGIPTEFESVSVEDLDGKWELIETFTANTECSFKRSTEPNGNPYNFKAALVKIIWPQTRAAKDVGDVRITDSYVNLAWGRIGRPSQMQETYASFCAYLQNGYWDGWYDRVLNKFDSSSQERTYMSNKQLARWDSTRHIKEISVQTLIRNAVVEIYGVRF